MSVGKGNISGMGASRAQAWDVNMQCVLGDPFVILCIWNIEGRLECAASEAG